MLTVVARSRASPAGRPSANRPRPASRPSAPATQPATGPAAKPADLRCDRPGRRQPDKPGEWASYDAMHQYFVKRFVASDGFGYERMMTPRTLARSNVLYMEGQHFRIGTVELISLGGGKDAKGGGAAKPFAYTTPHLDAMKETIKKAEHRPLKEVEARALAQLREGRQSVLAGDNDRPTLVGAVRAIADCLKCHDAKEGELLGAFSYPLVPVEAPADGNRRPRRDRRRPAERRGFTVNGSSPCTGLPLSDLPF